MIVHSTAQDGILLMASVMCLHFGMQDNLEHIVDKCHMFTFWYARGK